MTTMLLKFIKQPVLLFLILATPSFSWVITDKIRLDISERLAIFCGARPDQVTFSEQSIGDLVFYTEGCGLTFMNRMSLDEYSIKPTPENSIEFSGFRMIRHNVPTLNCNYYQRALTVFKNKQSIWLEVKVRNPERCGQKLVNRRAFRLESIEQKSLQFIKKLIKDMDGLDRDLH